MIADEALHRHAVENLVQADALLFGRVTYEMMEAAWRPPARTGARPDWMEPFARTIDAAKKYDKQREPFIPRGMISSPPTFKAARREGGLWPQDP
jgi:hypothetical protein